MAIGNQNTDTDYTVHCIHCGATNDLKMMAHRTDKNVVGFVFVCTKCTKDVDGIDLIPKWKNQ